MNMRQMVTLHPQPRSRSSELSGSASLLLLIIPFIHGVAPLAVKLDLSTSIIIIHGLPHRCTQRLALSQSSLKMCPEAGLISTVPPRYTPRFLSQAILSPTKSTTNINHYTGHGS